jgi:hypothetical protein
VTPTRFLQAGLVGLLIASASACGGSSQKLYDAHATYSCLTNRPEYWGATHAPPESRLTFIVPILRDKEHPGVPASDYSRVYDTTVASGTALTVVFFGPGQDLSGGSQVVADVLIFDKPRSASALYRMLAARGTHDQMMEQSEIFRSANRKYQKGNVFIQWDLPSPPKQDRGLVLGCLRTHSLTT